MEFGFDKHSKLISKKDKIVFPRISLSKIKENEFKDKFNSEKYFYASIKLIVSIKYNDHYFENLD